MAMPQNIAQTVRVAAHSKEEAGGFLPQLLEIDSHYQKTMGPAYGSDPWGRAQFLADRPMKWALSQFAWSGDRLAGFWIASRTSPSRCQVHRVAVRESHRGLGVAQALAMHFVDTAQALGLREAMLEVACSNQEAIKFYADRGFAAVEGEGLVQYLAEKGRVAIVRQNRLVEPAGAAFQVMLAKIEAGS